VIVVSGLPRSGTSLMMQMLFAGGVPVLSDSHREADPSNPRGYFEYEPVKRLHSGDHAWLRRAGGHAVKVISALLPALPTDYPYTVLFMQRDLNEVVRSQMAMLERMGRPTPDRQRLHDDTARHLAVAEAWLNTQNHVRWQAFPYAELVEAPQENAVRVARFLNRSMNLGAMVKAVDPVLYRERR
jgi:hypothetical protein